MNRNPIEIIQNHYAERATAKKPTPGTFRASSAGYGLRRLVLSYNPALEAKPYDPRAIRVFEHGDQRHYSLRRALRDRWPELPVGRLDQHRGLIDEDADEETLRTIEIGQGWSLAGSPDGVLHDVEVNGRHYERAILEIKTMSSFGFKRAKELREYNAATRTWTELSFAEGIGPTYLTQVAMYAFLEELDEARDGIVWILEAKDTQALHQVATPPPISLVGPTLEKLRRAAAIIDSNPTVEEIVVGPDALPICEGKDFGLKKDGAMNWGCSYCPFWTTCFPHHVQTLAAGKRVTLPDDRIKPGSTVIEMGNAVVPLPTWNVLSEEGSDDE